MWCDTSQTPVVLGIDARAYFGILLWGLHWRLWTFLLAISLIIFFGISARMGKTLPFMYRRFRNKLAGKTRYARPWWYWRRFRNEAF